MNLIRLNPEDIAIELSIYIDDCGRITGQVTFLVRGQRIIISLEQITRYWYRRGSINFKSPEQFNNAMELELQDYLDKEWKVVSHFVFNRLQEKRKLGNIKDNQINKLEVLVKASAAGLAVPETILTTSTESLPDFPLITKCFYHGGFSIKKQFSVGSLTQAVSRPVSSMHSTFFPSLFQSHVKKKYELRIFYLKGDVYSAAIFSQRNGKTSVDFRNYDREKPNRVVPYKLPLSVIDKIRILMENLQLDSGSIDMIVTPHNEYIFLEVNPVGQFKQVSVPCNYYLEEKIANYLLGNVA